MKMFRVLFLIACALSCSAMCRADRDIVYSARYYLKPGSKGKSHYHLYRINPDGTGKKQITSGPYDDDNPQWSPDGKWLLFQHSNDDYTVSQFRMVDANGGSLRILRSDDKNNAYSINWSPHPDVVVISRSYSAAFHLDSNGNRAASYVASALFVTNIKTGATRRYGDVMNIVWSPAGTHYATFSNSGQCNVYDWSSGKLIAETAALDQPDWADENTLVGQEKIEDSRALMIYNVTTRQTRKLPLVAVDDRTKEALENYLRGVERFPAANTVLIHNFGFDEVRTNSYYKVNLSDGKLSFFTISESISWSGDGQRFCTTPYSDTAEFDKKRNGDWRLVYVSPLQVGSTDDGKLHNIVHGMVSVMSCDWRKNGK